MSEGLLVDINDEMSSVDISSSENTQPAEIIADESSSSDVPPLPAAHTDSIEPKNLEPEKKDDFEDIAKCGIVEVSGCDINGRPVIVVSACKLPPTKELDHKRFLNYLKQTLDRYVESDYSLVYFHHGLNSSNKPNFSWLVDAYREFDRKYKKNLKTMFIVHPSMMIKVIYNIFRPVISAKFGRKIRYCNYLNDMSDVIQLKQIIIPDAVKLYDENLMRKVKSKTENAHEQIIQESTTTQYGVSLKFLEENNPGIEIPRVVHESIEYLKENGLETEGIFRRSPSAVELKNVINSYNAGDKVTFESPHTAAVALKTFFRRLPEPILTYELYSYVLNISHVDEETRVRVVEDVLKKLPSNNYKILKYLVDFLHLVIENSHVNKMNSNNMATVFGPNLSWGRDEQSDLFAMGHINTFAKVLFDNHEQLFSVDSEC